MKEAPIPDNEAERQAAIDSYRILDTLPERAYDDITALMARVCDTPIALVGIIEKDRHWLKSFRGIDFNQSPRNISFCGHAIVADEELFIVEDARLDERFHDNPLVEQHGVVGYAGAQLIDKDGLILGTLCVFDTKPMILSENQKESLKSMARQVMYLFERHLRENTLEEAKSKVESKNKELEQYAGILSHDMKTPVNHIIGYIGIIEDEVRNILTGEMLDCFEQVKSSSIVLSNYIDSLLKYYTNSSLMKFESECFKVTDILDNMNKLVPKNGTATLRLPDTDATIHTNKAALTQILLNLISNAIKYGNDKHTIVRIEFYKSETHNHFSITDNGIGIAPEYLESIFDLFSKVDANSDIGTGIGLAAVRKLTTNLGGTIKVESILGEGSTFHIMLPRRINSQGIQ